MLLHIGSERTVYLPDVVVILDKESATHQPATREFLRAAMTAGRLARGEPEDEVKSYVVTTSKVLRSPISSLTLAHRAHAMQQGRLSPP